MKDKFVNKYKKYFNVFSNIEKKNQARFSSLRTQIFKPLLKLLAKLKITPDLVTFFSIIIMLGFVYFYLKGQFKISFIFLFLNIFADGIDGSLARFQKIDTGKGALTDIFADHFTLAVFALTLIYAGTLDPTITASYLILYFIMVLEVLILNIFEKNYNVIIRTKYTFYALIFAHVFFDLNIVFINVCLAIFSVYMLFFDFIAFLRIRDILGIDD